MPILPELIRYLRHPVFTTARVPMTPSAGVQLLKLLGLTYVLAVMSATIAHSLYSVSSGQTAETSKAFKDMSKGSSFLFIAIILAPLIEELLFRSWLGRIWGILLAMPVLLAITAALSLYGHRGAIAEAYIFGILIVLGSLALYLQRYFDTKPVKDQHKQAVQQLFPYIFWGTTVIFALTHVQNYTGVSFQPFLILLVIPQFIAGATLGFIRMRFGLWQAMGFHASYNGLAIALSLLA